MQVDAEKVRDDGGNRLQDLAVTFRVAFPDGTGGDAARELLPRPYAGRTTGSAR